MPETDVNFGIIYCNFEDYSFKFEQNYEILNTIEKDSFEDRAFGSILGSFIGDSIGSYLQSIPYVAPEEEVDKAIQMPGGGQWNVAPG